MPSHSRSCLLLLLGLAVGALTARAGEQLRESRPGARRGTNLLNSNSQPKRSILDRMGDGPARPAVQSPPVPGGVLPPPAVQEMDPKDERRLRNDLDRRRNWLLENAARLNAGETGTAGLERDRRRDSGRPGVPDNIDRLLKATDRGSDSEQALSGKESADGGRPGAKAADGEGEFGGSSRDGRDSERAGGAGKEETPAGQVAGFELPGFVPRSGSGADPDSPRARPESTLFPDAADLLSERQKEASTRARDESFNQLLNDVSREGGAGDPLVNRATATRRDQFQNLLAGPAPLAGPAVKSPSLFDSPVSTPGAAARTALPEGPARSSAPVFDSPRPAAGRPAPGRVEPRPLIIPIPTRGY